MQKLYIYITIISQMSHQHKQPKRTREPAVPPRKVIMIECKVCYKVYMTSPDRVHTCLTYEGSESDIRARKKLYVHESDARACKKLCTREPALVNCKLCCKVYTLSHGRVHACLTYAPVPDSSSASTPPPVKSPTPAHQTLSSPASSSTIVPTPGSDNLWKSKKNSWVSIHTRIPFTIDNWTHRYRTNDTHLAMRILSMGIGMYRPYEWRFRNWEKITLESADSMLCEGRIQRRELTLVYIDGQLQVWWNDLDEETRPYTPPCFIPKEPTTLEENVSLCDNFIVKTRNIPSRCVANTLYWAGYVLYDSSDVVRRRRQLRSSSSSSSSSLPSLSSTQTSSTTSSSSSSSRRQCLPFLLSPVSPPISSTSPLLVRPPPGSSTPSFMTSEHEGPLDDTCFVVYRVQPGGYKYICCSINPSDNMSRLQTNNHRTISLITTIHKPKHIVQGLNRWLYKTLSDYHLKGRWFDIAMDRLMDFINMYTPGSSIPPSIAVKRLDGSSVHLNGFSGISGIYFLRAEHMVKIGMSKNVRERLMHINKSNPVSLTLEWVYETKHNVSLWEKAFHAELHQWHIRGEWFDIPSTFDYELCVSTVVGKNQRLC